MFGSRRDRAGVDRICKTRKIGTDGDEECDQTLPIDAVDISVSSVWVVESRHVDVTTLD